MKYPRTVRLPDGTWIYRGSPLNIFNVWKEYLSFPYCKAYKVIFFHLLNCCEPDKRFYRVDGIGDNADGVVDILFPFDVFNAWKIHTGTNYHPDQFWNILNYKQFPTLFDGLFNIWLEELDEKYLLLSEIDPDNENYSPYTENYTKVDCLTLFFMALRGQIV
jgi:hypothetical protein